MAPLNGICGDRIEHDLAQHRAVDLRTEVAGVLVRVCINRAEDLLAVDEAVTVTLGARVLLEEWLKAILAQSTLAAVVSEVEGAAEVDAGGGVGFALVEGGWYAPVVEGEEEGETAQATADDCDTGLGGDSSVCHSVEEAWCQEEC